MKKTITTLLAGVSILFALAAPVHAQEAKPADAPAAAAVTNAANATNATNGTPACTASSIAGCRLATAVPEVHSTATRRWATLASPRAR